MNIRELKGAWLDYWVAVAEGHPRERLEIREVPRTDLFMCVLLPDPNKEGDVVRAMNYSSDWEMAGALIDKYWIMIEPGGSGGNKVCAYMFDNRIIQWNPIEGKNSREAVCRAVVLSLVGPVVDDVDVTVN